MNQSTLVLYHGNCSDGFGGAFAAWKKFSDRAIYIPAFHGERPPAEIKGRTLFLINFCYDREIMDGLRQSADRVVVIDHHKSRREIIESFPEHLFSQDHSGASLAWQYFHPTQPIPRLIDYIEDWDLWCFKFNETKAVRERLRLVPFEFKLWDTLIRDLDSDNRRQDFIQEGNLLVQYKDRMVQNIAGEDAYPIQFEGHEVFAANSIMFTDDLAEVLYKQHPHFSVIWSRGEGKTHVSLRSDGQVDVSEIAEKYGGGGHATSAGFILNSLNLPWEEIQR